MISGRRPGRGFIPKQFIDYYNSPYKNARLISTALATAGAATIDELAELSGTKRSAVRQLLTEMRFHKFLYVSDWRKTVGKGRAPVYSIGNREDAPRQNKKQEQAALYAAIKNQVVKQQTAEQRMSERCTELSALLVPQRTEAERRAINRKYLSWMFMQSSGALHNHGARNVT